MTILRERLLGTEAIYRLVARDNDICEVEVIRAPSLEPGLRLRLTAKAINHMTKETKVGELRVMGQKGDTRTIWNPENKDETRAAKDLWDNLVGKRRFLAFKVKEDGGKGEQIREWDPKAAKLIIVPPMAGGC